MFFHVQNLINDIEKDEPDPGAANALQEGLGGQFGEMRTMMQYLFQAMNFRGPSAKPYRDLIQGIGMATRGWAATSTTPAISSSTSSTT